jgi:hypothetical protein
MFQVMLKFNILKQNIQCSHHQNWPLFFLDNDRNQNWPLYNEETFDKYYI